MKRDSILSFLGENVSGEKESFSVRKKHVLGENVYSVQSIDELLEVIGKMKVYYSEVTAVKHRRHYKDRVYEWIEKRITLPSDWDTDIVYVFRREDFEKLMYAIKKLVEMCRSLN